MYAARPSFSRLDSNKPLFASCDNLSGSDTSAEGHGGSVPPGHPCYIIGVSESWWEIKRPCPRAWASERERREIQHCDSCDTTIVNLSRLTQKEARRKYDAGQLKCVRYHAGPDGAPIFRQPPPNMMYKAAAVGLAASLAACSPVPPDPEKLQAQTEVQRLKGELERARLERAAWEETKRRAKQHAAKLELEVKRLRELVDLEQRYPEMPAGKRERELAQKREQDPEGVNMPLGGISSLGF